MSIRPYQKTAIDAALAALDKSGSAIMQMPTGAGKTKSATEVVRTSDGPVWFVCHRQEIERQVARAFTEAGIEFGIVSPRGAPEYDKRVQIVSVHTLRRRIADLPQPSLVVWDECHHVAAKTWAALREQLSGAKHLGLTATPERLDGKGLREWFDDLIVGPSIEQLIADGWLSPARYFAPSDPDLTAAKLQAGDYAKKDADAVMNTPVLIGDAVAEYKRNASGKRALAFCTSVAASEALVARFNAEGIPAQHVDGTTPDDARSEAIAALADGRVKVLSNVEVFTEGFDVPGIDAVILMRPTKSPTLLLQMIGRALRVSPGKAEAIIMDHAGLHRDHGWFADNWHWELDGGAAKAGRRTVERGPRKCPECHEVRADRVPVCACGYEFPSGREIGEFDGVLNEIRGVVPEGCETRYSFGLRHGLSNFSVGNLIERGLPFDGGYVLDGADDWLVSYRGSKEVPKGFVTMSTFAARLGVSLHAVRKWAAKGMPFKKRYGSIVPYRDAIAWLRANIDLKSTKLKSKPKSAPDGTMTLNTYAKRLGFARHTSALRLVKHGLPFDGKFVPIDEADAWVKENPDKLNMARKLSKSATTKTASRPAGCETVHAFSVRISVSHDTVKAYIKRGMPSEGKFIPISSALDWVKKNIDGTEPTGAFAARHGVSKNSVGNWIRRGMPAARYGRIPSVDADAWVQQNVETWRIVGKNKKSSTNLSIPEFSKRIGASVNTIRRLVKNQGLPYDPKLGVPIQAGLEWVRDNRPDIVIPPEAWPDQEPERKAS